MLRAWTSPAVALALTLVAQPASGGPAFPVSEGTGYQRGLDVAADGAGNFVVVWGNEPYGAFPSTRGRRFDVNGTPFGTEFVLDDEILAPAIASDSAGNFVLVWTDFDADGGGIVGRRFDAGGAPLTAEFPVNAYTTGDQFDPAIAMDSSGAFTVVWQGDGDQEAPGFVQGGIFGRRFDAATSPLAGDFHVNTYTTGFQGDAAIAARPDGDFVVVWFGYRGPLDTGVSGQRYDADGTAVAGEFVISDDERVYPDVAMADDGGFLVAWTFSGNALFPVEVEARAYDATGTPSNGGFDVSDPGGRHELPQVASDGLTYLIGWTHTDSVGRSRAVARRYGANGSPLGAQFSLERAPNQIGTYLARGGAGELLAAWIEVGDEPFDDTVVARQIRPGRVLGRRCTVRETASGARRIVCQGIERTSPNFVIGDPVASGASLRVVTTGAVPSDQTFTLPAGPRWTPVGSGPDGYRYSDALGDDGPVRSVFLRRSTSHSFQMKVTIAGTSAAPAPGVQIVPPDPGGSIVIALGLGGGETYCVGLGAGQGGGTIGPNDASTFRVRNAANEAACP